MKITIVTREDHHPDLRKLKKNFDIVKDGDVYIAIGGDGTFIKAAQMTDKPVLLIRDGGSGSIGYHSDLSTKDLDFIIKHLKNNDYHIEEVSNKLEVEYKNKNYFCINEARLNNIVEEVSFNIYLVNGNRKERITPFIMSGDGIIVSSKMGSTAYNKSAGGPVLLTSKVFCVTFINADGPYNNPIVLDSDKEIEIEIVKYEGTLGFDNTKIADLKKGDRFRIRMSDRKINVVRFRGRSESFAEKLERKIKSRLAKRF
jgi:NAD+ kinase